MGNCQYTDETYDVCHIFVQYLDLLFILDVVLRITSDSIRNRSEGGIPAVPLLQQIARIEYS